MKNKSIKLDKCTSLSDVIDDYCQFKYGHTNWVWYDEEYHCEIEDDVAEVEGEIMFYYKEDEEHEEDDHRNCKITGVNKASIGL